MRWLPVIFMLYSTASLAAEIQGRVLNAQGAAVPGARIVVATPQGAALGEAYLLIGTHPERAGVRLRPL
ncbi:MAG TPA: hypothetical protein VH744_03610, partial [Terriglobales bacterium]